MTVILTKDEHSKMDSKTTQSLLWNSSTFLIKEGKQYRVLKNRKTGHLGCFNLKYLSEFMETGEI